MEHSGAAIVLDRLFDMLMIGFCLFGALPYFFGLVDSLTGLYFMLSGIFFGFAAILALYNPILGFITQSKQDKGGFSLSIPGFNWLLTEYGNINALSISLVFILLPLTFLKFLCSAARFILIAWALGLAIFPALVFISDAAVNATNLFALRPADWDC